MSFGTSSGNTTMPQQDRPRPTLGAPAPRRNGVAGRSPAAPEPGSAERRYRRLFETSRDGVLVLDADTARITDVNPFLEDLLGYSHDELIGRELWEIVAVRDVQAGREAAGRLQRDGGTHREELPLETRSKQRRQVELVSNVFSADGARVIQCNVRDVTKRRLAEERLRASMESLAAQVADMRQRDLDMSRLNQMNDLLHSCATHEEAYEVITKAAEALFAGQRGFLALLDSGDRRVETVAQWGEAIGTVAGFALSDCWALRRGQVHEVVEVGDGLVCPHFADPPATGSLCVPLTVQGLTLGLLCLTARPGAALREPMKRLLAVSMGESIKLSLSNLRLRERLREEATLDSLTGLWNRRYLDEMLAREIHRARRLRTPLCVAMLDLDHFKEFNDAFGHEAGDAVLRELGQVLRTSIRKSDIACRYGGEEFVLVFPDSPLSGARQRAEQILRFVGEIEIPLEGRGVQRVTASAGVAQADEQDSTPGNLLRAADEALYAAKAAGRNRVVEHRPRT